MKLEFRGVSEASDKVLESREVPVEAPGLGENKFSAAAALDGEADVRHWRWDAAHGPLWSPLAFPSLNPASRGFRLFFV